MVYTVCHSICIFLTCYSMVKSHCSNLRTITAIFLGSEFSKFYILVNEPRHEKICLCHMRTTRHRSACASAQSNLCSSLLS